MWDYTEKVLDHFRNPRNIGEVENPDGIGEVGSLACGDALKLTFKLGPDKRIQDIKFKTFGCASAIASSSALTEMVKGKTVEEASAITNQDIAEYLGGLPDQKMHCSVMGREALEAAISYYRTGKHEKIILEENIICTCFGVTEEEIRRAIRENSLTTVEEVTNYTKAGGGCGLCHPDIEQIIEEEKKALGAKATVSQPKKMTIVEKVKLIQETLETQVRPMLRKDGGDIELIDVEGNKVVVSFRGMCANCPSAQFTMKDVVEAKLKEYVSPDITVEEDKG